MIINSNDDEDYHVENDDYHVDNDDYHVEHDDNNDNTFNLSIVNQYLESTYCSHQDASQ